MSDDGKFYAPPPCKPGDSEEEIETPALLVCMDTLEANLDRMKELMKAFPGVSLRPHSKTHKSPHIAMMQV